jgi:uncharacterized membrane protein YidH (DUF202 family)
MTRPSTVFDPMLQQERTSLAWERTAIAGMAVGLLMARIGAKVHAALGAIGVAVVCLAGALLVWSGKHYEDLHGTLRSGESPARPGMARLLGLGATVVTGLATLLTLTAALTG